MKFSGREQQHNEIEKYEMLFFAGKTYFQARKIVSKGT